MIADRVIAGGLIVTSLNVDARRTEQVGHIDMQPTSDIE